MKKQIIALVLCGLATTAQANQSNENADAKALIAEFNNAFNFYNAEMTRLQNLRKTNGIKYDQILIDLETKHRNGEKIELSPTAKALFFSGDNSDLQKKLDTIRNFDPSKQSAQAKSIESTNNREFSPLLKDLLFGGKNSDLQKKLDAIRNFDPN